eukprot:9471989-Pyramimonas_sp.AAC.1
MMARMFAMLLNPRIAGRFSPDPSATLAAHVSSLAMAVSPRSRLCIGRSSFLMSWPCEREARSH